MKCALCGKPAEYVFGGFSLCESCMIQMRSLPIEPVAEPAEQAVIKNLHFKYPLHSEEQIAKMVEEEIAKGGGFVGFALAVEIVEKDLKKQYEVKKPVPPKESAPAIKPLTSLIAEIKTALDKEKLDVNRLKFEETEKTVVITPRAWLQDDWAIVNQIVKDFKGAWIRDGQQSRWEIKK